MTNKKRNISIDLLRSISILYIVGFWHLLNYTTAFPCYNNFITLRITNIILGLFIFISGYFIGLSHYNTRQETPFSFYKKKIIRIYPLYILAIIIFTILNLSSGWTSLKAIFAISMFVQPAPNTLWFITMLLFFYLLSPLIINICHRHSIKEISLYCTILILTLVAYGFFTKLLDVRIVLYFPSFVMGILVAMHDEQTNVDLFYPYKKNFYFVLIILSIGISFIKTNHSGLNDLLHLPMVLLCSYIFFTIGQKIKIASTPIYNFIIIISYSSYCMYLFHRPIYVVLKKIYFPKSDLFQVIYLVMFCVPLIIIISFILQKIYDLACDRFIPKRTEVG
jgi:peptidoglycan/LPS O-acetylase OafA/YrhL